MKRLGLALIIIGLLLTIITGFKFFTKEKVAEVGNIKISANKSHVVDWSPYLGVGILVVGGILFLADRRRL